MSQSKETNSNAQNNTDDFKFLIFMLPIPASMFSGTYLTKEVRFCCVVEINLVTCFIKYLLSCIVISFETFKSRF